VARDGHASTQDDDEILVRHARNDREAFAAIYERYFSRVYWYRYGRLQSPQAAEDATSLVFTKALHALPQYREQESALAFRAWLFRIAHNVIVDELRARRPYAPLAAAHEIPAPMLSPESALLQAEDRNLVWALLDTLPPDQRQIVELRLAGLNGPEIAQVLGKNRGAVNTAQSRAVARLRTVMGITRSVPGEEGPDAIS
jgi:RNA polymerase sigma-70 factor (ECF subfamily)